MGNRIEFPHNIHMAEKFFNEAQAFLDEHKEEDALEKMEKAYSFDRSPETVMLYAAILGMLDRHEEGLEIANKDKAYFMNDKNGRLSYTLLLIANGHYIEAENIIMKRLNKGTPSDQEDWNILKENLELNREVNIKHIENVKIEVKEKLQEIENYPVSEQYSIMRDAALLDLADLQVFARKIFSSIHITGFVQRLFLEHLIERRDDNEYNFLYLNQYKKITPSEHYIFGHDPYVNSIQDELATQLSKHPSLFDQIENEMISDLLILFPFIKENIPDIPYFVNYYVSYLDPNNMVAKKLESTTEEHKKVDEWLNYLNDIADRPSI